MCSACFPAADEYVVPHADVFLHRVRLELVRNNDHIDSGICHDCEFFIFVRGFLAQVLPLSFLRAGEAAHSSSHSSVSSSNSRWVFCDLLLRLRLGLLAGRRGSQIVTLQILSFGETLFRC